MRLKLYNTRSRSLEPFYPMRRGQVTMYVCGPTVYDRTHLGNARPNVVFDVLHRFLKLTHKVIYVRNITDVDDKILRAAESRGISYKDIAQEYTHYFHQDMQALNVLPPTYEPRATNHVKDMIHMIRALMDQNHAYEEEGHVFFDVTTFGGYGALTGGNLFSLRSGVRIEPSPFKRHDHDFVLWKPAEPHEVGWQSPWGYGRPGWHIECSAMSKYFFRGSFDIHGGGQDLIFPHHENERAQSCALHGDDTYARYWMHNGMVKVNGEKMSKSLGNFIIIDDLLCHHRGEMIRLGLLMSHYRQPLNWREDTLNLAKASLDKFYRTLQPLASNKDPFEEDPQSLKNAHDPDFMNALNQDLNIPEALAALHQLCRRIQHEKNPQIQYSYQKVLLHSGRILGLFAHTPQTWFQGKNSDMDSSWDEAMIQEAIEKRDMAKRQGDYESADTIRDHLKSQGVLLEDTPYGTTWKWM